MGDINIFALLIQAKPAEAGLLPLGVGGGALQLQCVERIPTRWLESGVAASRPSGWIFRCATTVGVTLWAGTESRDREEEIECSGLGVEKGR